MAANNVAESTRTARDCGCVRMSAAVVTVEAMMTEKGSTGILDLI